ncbi:hypothetical protein DFH06DRAFT_902831, partial [Mycena polygramma]
ADGPGLTCVNGLCGHHGAYGCRLYCSLKGRHKNGSSTYYPVLKKPNNYDVAGCDHEDVDPSRIPPASEEEYLANLAYVVGSRDAAE